MSAPGARAGSTAAPDPGSFTATHDAAIAGALARTITQAQLDQAIAATQDQTASALGLAALAALGVRF